MKTIMRAAGAALGVMLLSAVAAGVLHRGWGTASWHTGHMGADVDLPGRVWFAFGRLGGEPSVALGWLAGLLVPFAALGHLQHALHQPPYEPPRWVAGVAWLAAAAIATSGITAFFQTWMFYGGTQMDHGEGELWAGIGLAVSFIAPAAWLLAAHLSARLRGPRREPGSTYTADDDR